eukprot:TRINITY_DN8614_c0_g1_i1.p1 TRINITY_DN8614_c0_g1~~TRINITY_DN8614_c0_g1_i1.p1  ORF type:complete len:1771 (-),score=292.93 TRINITY_DN8614_c0_g1_i1:115-5427(-)
MLGKVVEGYAPVYDAYEDIEVIEAGSQSYSFSTDADGDYGYDVYGADRGDALSDEWKTPKSKRTQQRIRFALTDEILGGDHPNSCAHQHMHTVSPSRQRNSISRQFEFNQDQLQHENHRLSRQKMNRSPSPQQRQERNRHHVSADKSAYDDEDFGSSYMHTVRPRSAPSGRVNRDTSEYYQHNDVDYESRPQRSTMGGHREAWERVEQNEVKNRAKSARPQSASKAMQRHQEVPKDPPPYMAKRQSNSQKQKPPPYSWLVGKDLNSHEMQNAPAYLFGIGPGMIESDSKSPRKAAQAYSKMLDLQNRNWDTSPSPMSYEPPPSAIGSAPSCAIGQASRGELFKVNESPGPAQYDVPSSIGKGPKYSMPGRTSKPEAEDSPGPSSYQKENTRPKSPGFTLKQRPKSAFDRIAEKAKKENIPGPGEYNQRLQQHVITPKMGRPPAKKKQEITPGPGEYKEPELIGVQAPAYTIGLKREEKFDSSKPGPGMYKIPSTIGQGPAAIISSASNKPPKEPEVLPGPGQYAVTPRFGDDAPHATLTGKREQKIPITPGPGQYNVAVKETTPEFSFGTSQRDTQKDVLPGPGQYFVKSEIGAGPKVHMASSQRPNHWVKTVAPDVPHAYDLSAKDTGPMFTMGTPRPVSPRTKEAALTPGPGEFQIPSTIGKGPSFSMSGRVEAPIKLTPGPGDYKIDSMVGKEGPKYTISYRYEEKYPEGPGPGQYESKTLETAIPITIGSKLSPRPLSPRPGPTSYQRAEFMPEGPEFTIGKRLSPPNKEPNPGPGEYYAEAVTAPFENAPKYTIGGKFTPKDPREDVPAPGEYYVPSKSDGPAFTMGMPRLDLDLYKAAEAPGPGEYNVKSTIGNGPAPSIGLPAPERSDLGDAPGPGTYTVPPTLGTGPSFSIGVRVEGRDAASLGNATSPSPQYYNVQHTAVESSAPAFSIGLRHVDRDDKRDIPGPGTYTIERPLGSDAPQISIHPPFPPASQTSNISPGPGAYEVSMHMPLGAGAPAYSFGAPPLQNPQNPQISNLSKISPGPGEYDVRADATLPSAPAYHFPRAERPPSERPTDAPPPTQYFAVPYSTFVPAAFAPAYSLGARFDTTPSSDAVQTPAPNTYNLPSTIGDGPKFSIAPKQKDDAPSITPAPNKYNIPSTLGDAPKFSIAPRIPIPNENKDSDTPGPDAYDVEQKKPTGPAYSFGVRLVEVKPIGHDTPGPGEYVAPSYITDGPAPWMGNPPEERQTVETVPGPGHYTVPSRIGEGPAYSFYGPHEEKIPDLPGPGHYELPTMIGKDTPSFTIHGRLPEPAPPQVPPPGKYDAPSYIGKDTPSFTFPQAVPAEPKNTTPGPGQYAAPTEFTGDQGFWMGVPQIPKSQTHDMPAPGQYYKELKPEGPSFTFGKDLIDPKPIDPSPGPGHYSYKEYIGEGPSYTIQGPHEIAPQVLPGPGAYDLAPLPTGPAYFMGLPTMPSAQPTLPGPGDYEIGKLDKFPKAPEFTISGKPAPSPPDYRPGPGYYEYKTYTADGPKFTIPQHQDPLPLSSAIGPGAYDPRPVTKNEPTFTIGAKHSEPKHLPLPGPGDYEPKKLPDGTKIVIQGRRPEPAPTPGPGPASYDPRKPEPKQSIVIGTRRPMTVVTDTPGPGQYYKDISDPRKFKGPKFTMGALPPAPVIHDMPGPGAYEVKPEKRENLASFSKAPLMSSIVPVTDTVGPGAYDVQVPPKHRAPSFGLGSKAPEPKVDTNPGPQKYDPKPIDRHRPPTYKFSQSKRSEAPVTDAPGVGTYNLTNH